MLTLTGRGLLGVFEERKKCSYNGNTIGFRCPPEVLNEIVQQYDQVLIAPQRLKVTGKKFVYVSCLEDHKVEE